LLAIKSNQKAVREKKMTTLYGIKNCDTVKKARSWLESHKVNYHFHDFRSDGITPAMVTQWINELGLDTLVNKRSTTWKELAEDIKQHFDASNAVAVIVANPTLIKRPLLDTGSQRLVGFKEADYHNLFN
jgi:arsenate reductase